MPAREILFCEGGITGTFTSVPTGVKVVYSAKSVTLKPVGGMSLFVR